MDGLSLLLVGVLSIGVVACGDSGSDESGGSPAFATQSEPIKIPKLSQQQEDEAVAIAKQNPVFQEITDGSNPTVNDVGVWTRSNNEFLGAGIQFTLATPGSYNGSDWPEIENKDELYGPDYGEEGDPGEVEEGVRPEIGTSDLSVSDVGQVIVMVDLSDKTVAEMTAIPIQ